MSELVDTARRALFWRAVEEQVKDQADRAVAEAREVMRELGAERTRIHADDGAELGVVTLSRGKPKAAVVDEAAFKSWVASRHPEELMTVVNPAFVRKILSDAEKEPEGLAVDRDTGEVIPGIALLPRQGSVIVRKTEEARARAVAALTTLRTALEALPPAGEGDD